MLKFIHAGDVHLGNPFVGLDRQMPTQLKAEIREATIVAFTQLIDAALTEQVDFVLLPGDLYHAQENSPYIQNVLVTQFHRLAAVDIPVYLSFGNHDVHADRYQHLTWPSNVHVFPETVTTFTLITREGLKIGLTGFSYQDQRQRTAVLSDFPLKDSSFDYQIGLYHGSQGKLGDSYAAFQLPALLKKGYDYWALGHIHIRQILHKQPYIAYSGNLQGLNRKEAGPKGYYLVKEHDRQLVPTFQAVAPVVWQELTIKVQDSTADWLQQIKDYSTSVTTLLTVTLTGSFGSNLLMRLQTGILMDQARQAAQLNVWVVQLKEGITSQLPLRLSEIPTAELLATQASLLQPEQINNLLPEQLPGAIREYLLSSAGQAVISEKMRALLLMGHQDED